jgi:hypothetical protein
LRELNDINTSKQHRGANPRGIPMPTENRSSNTEMVSVPRELLERATKDYTGRQNWDALEPERLKAVEELSALLAQPAEQHQGKPAVWMFIGDDGHKHFSYSKQTPEHKPLYTHADPGEVERLRAEIQSLRKTLPNSTTDLVDLRAQLAERDALLRETRKFLDWPRHPLPEKIDATISASADASALVADPCRWSDQQVMDFLGVALRNVDLQGEVRLSEIRQGFQFMRDRGAL